MQGPATVNNISLRCRRHNQYEAELVFGSRGASTAGETWANPPEPRKFSESERSSSNDASFRPSSG